MQIFSKLLRKTDIEKRCVVPMKYYKIKCFPKLEGKDKVCFVVKDESGRVWTFCCSKRRIGRHPKPVLIGGWIPFVRENELCIGDRVIIDKEQDETGLMQLRIKVKKQTSPSEARRSPVKIENLDGNKGSATNNSATPTFKPFAATRSSIDKEQIPTHYSTSQDIETERPSLSLSLELTLKPTMTGGTTPATSYSIDKDQTPFPLSTSQDIACYRTEWPSLSLSLGLNPNPTKTGGGQQPVYMQETEPKTIEFLGCFL